MDLAVAEALLGREIARRPQLRCSRPPLCTPSAATSKGPCHQRAPRRRTAARRGRCRAGIDAFRRRTVRVMHTVAAPRQQRRVVVAAYAGAVLGLNQFRALQLYCWQKAHQSNAQAHQADLKSVFHGTVLFYFSGLVNGARAATAFRAFGVPPLGGGVPNETAANDSVALHRQNCYQQAHAYAGLQVRLCRGAGLPGRARAAAAEPRQSQREWPVYGGDAAGTKYSALDQINRANVRRLKPAWVYRCDDMRAGSRPAPLNATRLSWTAWCF